MKPRFIARVGALSESERFCTRCQKPLKGRRFAWLELDQRTYTYHDRGDVPADRSQGLFPFGLVCARKILEAAP